MWVVVGCRVIECRGMGVLGKGMRSHETFPSHMQHPVGTPFHASMLYRGGRPSSFAQSISWLNRCKPAIGSAASPFSIFDTDSLRYAFLWQPSGALSAVVSRRPTAARSCDPDRVRAAAAAGIGSDGAPPTLILPRAFFRFNQNGKRF